MSKVYIGMSGGVDSSVAAALLQEQGHDVTGVYMKNWTEDLPGMQCPWAEDVADAKRVAVQLGIPFKIFDFQAEYKDKVVGYMIDEYASGRTPNPDVMCNQEVKFKLFLDAALEDGADYIATGHYANVDDSSGRARLHTAHDTNKDQTYFLYRVTGEALAHTRFPLGGYLKQQVRELAKQRGLATAGKKDSQGICFVGKVGMRDFLSQYVKTEPGDIIEYDTDKVLGQHDGAIFYTIGQRHGLGLGGGLPYYVTGKDMKKNIVYATKKLNGEALWRRELRLTSLHWINEPPKEGKTYSVRSRYRAKLVPATVTALDGDELHLKLSESERAITPGQSTVFYQGDEVLGGGIVA